MGKFEPTYSVPELDVVESRVTEEFTVYEHPVEVIATTGMVEIYAGWRTQPERVVCFEGVMYDETGETIISEYEMFHVDVTLWPLPRWMEVLARLGNEEEPGSVEEFFYNFMLHLGWGADFYVDAEVSRDHFETLVESMIDAGAFAEDGRENESWKPHCQIYSKSVEHTF